MAEDGPSQSEGSTRVELINMSSIQESPSQSTAVPLTPTTTTGATQHSNYNDNGIEFEETQPLQAGAQSNAMPIMPKNRRRPGSSSDTNKLTMTGMVIQGSGSGGQPIEVEVELSQREFQRLTSRETGKHVNESCSCSCGLKQGLHIVVWSFLCIPIAFIISLCLSFYNGSITWYNLFIYLSEEKSIVHRVTLCPLLLLSFPLTVGLTTLGVAVVASVLQLSWSWISWKAEILDGEKGFYGWLCNKLTLPDCAPYRVVILEENAVF